MGDLGKRLELLRNLLGERRGKKRITQEEIAKIVGVDKQTWWRYENNQRALDMGILQKLVKATDVSPLWLLLGEGEIFMNQQMAALGVAEASAHYGLTDDERQILELLRANPRIIRPVLKLLLSGRGLKEALAELQTVIDPVPDSIK